MYTLQLQCIVYVSQNGDFALANTTFGTTLVPGAGWGGHDGSEICD
jgi:hypothetical protein